MVTATPPRDAPAPTPDALLPTPRARPALTVVVRHALAMLGGALDGFVVGFAVAYVLATALSGAGRELGYGPVPDVLVTSIAVLAVLGLLWGAFAAVIAAAGWARDRLPRLLERVRVRGAAATILTLPLRVVAAIPKLGVALMAAVLVIIYVIVPVGIGALIAPDGVLAPWLWFAGAAGAALGLARTALRGISGSPGTPRRAVALAGVAAAVLIAAWGGLLALGPGSVDHLVRPDPMFDGVAGPTELEDPGAPGPFEVETFSYGSGTDRRAAFGAEVLLRTPVVDASRALDPIGGLADEARELFWGFGTDALPLNARVWMPVGDGPFPLVLVVHGNHAMGAPNEAGYAYLGEHLASRGFITASVDESFLNGSWAGDWEGTEHDVRAWLLLLHLDQWRTWNAPGNPLEGRVDMGRVALIGHSRGGEAAAVAAAWSGLDSAFNPTLRPWPTGLEVRAVVAIAPSDGQVGMAVRLDDVDVLELTGGHDADARGWSGIRQYNRTVVGDDGFKAALYASRANHGQFNSVWGAGDHGRWSGALLNLAPLPAAAEQEDVAKTAIGAFLEESLHDRAGYRAFFRRPMAGREWLPADVYLVRSDDGAGTDLVAIDGGTDPAGLRSVGEAVATQRTRELPLRALQDTQQGRAAVLTWDQGPGDAVWGVEGLAAAFPAPAAAALELDVATGSGAPLPAGGAPAGGGELAAVDPLVEAWTTDGTRVALPLSTWGALPPPLVTRLAKDDLAAALAGLVGLDLSLRSPAEQVVQSYVIPLDAFAAVDPAFRVERLDGIALRVPRTTAGSLAVSAFRLAPASD